MKSLLTRLTRLLPIKEEHPNVTFDRVIGERRRRYGELKSAVVKVLFLRNKLEGDLLERRAEIARVHHEARSAARVGQDRRALALIERMNHLKDRLAHAEEQLDEIKREAGLVTEDMARINDAIRELEREKRESLARLSAAEVRKRIRELLDDSGDDRDARRLERVRTMVARASAEAALDDSLDGSARIALADPAARIELARLKQRLLPAI
jgi:phage shock protein A